MKFLIILGVLFSFIEFGCTKEILFKPRGRFFDKKFRLLIEDFFAKTDVEQQTQIDELLIGTSLATETNGNSLNFYSTAFDNLINIVPKLETLTIDGGYVLKPAFGTAEELKNEVIYLKEHMTSIISAAHEHNIEIVSLIVGVGYLFDTKIADNVGLESLLSENFPGSPIKDAQLYEYTMEFSLNGVRCRLSVTISQIETPSVPKGRIAFTEFSRLSGASMDTVARLYYNHVRISGRYDP